MDQTHVHANMDAVLIALGDIELKGNHSGSPGARLPVIFASMPRGLVWPGCPAAPSAPSASWSVYRPIRLQRPTGTACPFACHIAKCGQDCANRHQHFPVCSPDPLPRYICRPDVKPTRHQTWTHQPLPVSTVPPGQALDLSKSMSFSPHRSKS